MRGPKDGHQSRFAPPPPDAELPLFQLEGLGNPKTRPENTPKPPNIIVTIVVGGISQLRICAISWPITPVVPRDPSGPAALG
jgi:hypothetical protein